MCARRCRKSAIGVVQVCLAIVLCAGGCGYAAELPAGTTLEIRLTRSLASFSSKKGDEVQGIVIAPVVQNEQLLIPMGATITGTVLGVRRVGLGFIHENARLSIDFNGLMLPDGTQLNLSSQVVEIDNARESVDQRGRINGIRSTGTIGYRANNLIAGFAMFDPIAYVYVTVASARMLRFSEPEIWFPAGTELSVKVAGPLSGISRKSRRSRPCFRGCGLGTIRSARHGQRVYDVAFHCGEPTLPERANVGSPA